MKKNKHIISFILLAAAALVLVACNSGASSIDYKVGVRSSEEYPHITKETAILINSRAELDSICAELFYNDGPYAEEYRETKYLRNLAANYNDTYFTTKALVVYMFSDNSAGWSMQINNLILQENTLILSTKHMRPANASATVVVPWTYLIEVKKSEIKDATKVTVSSTEETKLFG